MQNPPILRREGKSAGSSRQAWIVSCLFIVIGSWRSLQNLNGQIRTIDAFFMEQPTEELHIGKEIKRIVKEQGRQTQWLADKLNYDRNNIYDIYKRRYIDTDVLLRISNVLEYDFFALYSQQIKSAK